MTQEIFTKRDFQTILRKELRNFATREDLKRELGNFATRDDLRNSVDELALITGEHFVRLEQKMATKQDIQELRAQTVGRAELKKQLQHL